MYYIVPLSVFLIWALWASLSTGGLYELKQINPGYAHPNKSVPYLVSKLNYSASSGFWDSYHVEQCWGYMPNWAKAETCVRERISCESVSPPMKDSPRLKRDVFSKEFESCWDQHRPFLGPSEWLRFSRFIWRAGIALGPMWLTGASTGGDNWHARHGWWAEPMIAWTEEGV